MGLHFDAAQIQQMAGIPGPWVTILLPPYRKGEPANPDTARLKTLLRPASDLGIPEELIAPLRELERNEALDSGGKGVALFSASGFAAGYRVDSPFSDKLLFTKYPFIKPLLAEGLAPHELFALALSRKYMRLFRYAYGACEEVPFPARVPTSIEQAMATDQPDHDLVNRSASGASTGSSFAVRFGTLTDRESSPEYLHHFFSIVDRGLHPVTKDRPVLLVGVAEEVAAYRKIATQLNLLDTDNGGGAEYRSLDEMSKQIRQSALAHYRKEGRAALRNFREMTNRLRVRQGLAGVLSASEQGRIHQVVIAEDIGVPAAHAPQRKDLMENDDLLNTIALETLRTGGQVFVLPAADMGDAAPVAAILRY